MCLAFFSASSFERDFHGISSLNTFLRPSIGCVIGFTSVVSISFNFSKYSRISPNCLASLFFSSSAEVYPIREGPIREDSTADPIDIYGITKVIGEDLKMTDYGQYILSLVEADR